MEKIELHLICTCLLELFPAVFLRKIIFINFYISVIAICSLDALKKSSKKKETGTEKEMIELLQQASDHRKKAGKKKIGMMKFLALNLYLPRLTVTLTSAFAFINSF